MAITKRVLELAPVSYDAYYGKIGQARAMELARELDALVAGAARLARYLDARAMGADHKLARKRSNRAVRKVRKALGYQTTHDLSY